ncbi:major facilitator superfamily domain-containing protein [Xylariaceae sp. FL0662B]|nr:major facilitator superfamily domain-containing protein [Xylariaceae sp. FL0662B]
MSEVTPEEAQRRMDQSQHIYASSADQSIGATPYSGGVGGAVPSLLTIVATAIPKITEEFESLDEVGWYGSAFFLTLAVFQSPWGKIYKYHPIKNAYNASVFIFELGSLICSVARNSQMLIAGRSITGCGGAGVTTATYVIISHLVPPSKASAFIGGIGAAFSIASVAGPLVGGAFTGEISWRFL